MGRKGTDPTMKDVAAEAGVALGTVSKVVNGLPVGSAYQKKVEDAIEKLGYQINSYAQGLKAGKTNAVALIVPNTNNPFFGELTYYVNRALIKRSCRMLLWCTDADARAEQMYMSSARQNKVDGIISLSYSEALEFPEGVPVVTIDRQFSSAIPCITSDNFSGGQIAAKKLDALGCRRVAFFGIGSPLSTEAVKRADGFRSTCAALELDHEVLYVEDGTPYSVFRDFLIRDMEQSGSKLDGIFCITDHLAHIVITYLQELGRKVPDDVQVIGFDGLRDYSSKALLCSTIVQSVEKIAEMSVETVLSGDRLNAPSLICLPVEYAFGGTTKE